MDNTDEEVNTFIDVDESFINKHKKTICDFILKRANDILQFETPSDNRKLIKFDAAAKDQIMYIIYITLNTISSQDNIDSEKDIGLQIKNKLDTKCSGYMIYSLVYGITNNMKYNSNDDDLLSFIFDIIKEEKLIQHSIEIISVFIKILSEKIARYNWDTVKTVKADDINTILRLVDSSNINPKIFKEIYDFSILSTKRRKKL